ncbi:sugar transporter family protein [Cadophora sp. DSE1049]|nr:sugar transporter family protein [Cadophora sp. DSE1049]
MGSIEGKATDQHLEFYQESEPKMGMGEYISTRLSSLKPPMSRTGNPFAQLSLLNRQQWLFFLVGFLGWTWDAFDFFTVSLTVQPLAKEFGKTNSQITWGITLVLMLRSVGSALFGLASDRYGRKWTFIFNNLLFIVLELGTGFTNDYKSFLACRALFGIAMGGLYGNAAATALEDCPPEARGIISGMFQVGYSFGYLLATVFSRALVNTTPHGWRPLFWFGACPPILIIIFRMCLPETASYQERERVRETQSSATKSFLMEGKLALKKHWLVLIYLVMLMAGVNFMAHGTQDLYPVLLQNQFQFSPNAVTVTQVVANLGAMSGGITVGYLSDIFGRRLCIMVSCLIAGALIYPYSFVSTHAIIAVAFFEQFFVQGAFGVIPVHLMELSPGAFRAFVVGTAYQLGNLASSASSTIESTIGERFPLPPMASGVKRYQYGKVICIFVACSLVYMLVLVLVGPEKKGRLMGVLHDADTVEAVGLGDPNKICDILEDAQQCRERTGRQSEADVERQNKV